LKQTWSPDCHGVPACTEANDPPVDGSNPMNMARSDKAIDKYCAHYAEPEAARASAALSAAGAPSWQYCLVIPAYNEPVDFLQRLCRSSTSMARQSCLLILVINQPDTGSAATAANERLWQQVTELTLPVWRDRTLMLRRVVGTESHLLAVDRFRTGLQLPAQQGVGLARKIGADIGVALIKAGQIACPWLYTTDADVHLPENYFCEHSAPNGTAAINFRFRHRCGADRVGVATSLYERSLIHYVNGLRTAGSPYAFHSVGSALAMHFRHYCQVRGFPRRAGGEDFYLLNKLAKTGTIHEPEHPVITIEARLSCRAPFGTGPAVARIMALADPQRDYRIYDPALFGELADWLGHLSCLHQQSLAALPLSTPLRHVLIRLGVNQAREHASRHSSNTEDFVKHMHIWFDGFRTLKLVHGLQELCYPPVPVRFAL